MVRVRSSVHILVETERLCTMNNWSVAKSASFVETNGGSAPPVAW